MFRPHHITKRTALALALGAIAAPVASANTVAYSQQDKQLITAPAAQPSSNGSSSIGGQGAPPILPAPTPAQSAAIQRAEQQAAHRPTVLTGARYSNADINAYPSGSPAARASVPDSGFDWGDAGIGAAGGFAIAMLGVGGGLALSQRRSRRPGTSALATS
ncbi:MAG: hypothetical protein ACTHQQ_23720 [Solirubrobacteraceae bacterium]